MYTEVKIRFVDLPTSPELIHGIIQARGVWPMTRRRCLQSEVLTYHTPAEMLKCTRRASRMRKRTRNDFLESVRSICIDAWRPGFRGL